MEDIRNNPQPDDGNHPGQDMENNTRHNGEGNGPGNKNIEKPAWMTDPLEKEIPAKKLQFLEQLFAQGQGKSQKELMACLMPAMKKAKQENLIFTPQEVSAAIAAIKKYSSAEELKKIDKILEKSRQSGK